MHFGLRVVQDGADVPALQTCWDFDAAEFGSGGIEVEQFDKGIAHACLDARCADDERNARGLVVQTYFRPEIMLAEVVSMVAGEDDDRVGCLAGFFKRIEHPSNLGIHVAHCGIVAGNGLFLLRNIHFHI